MKLWIPNGWEKYICYVKAKIRTTYGLSDKFNNDIWVTKGYHLSPNLFSLYIVKIE